jgi:hypothetical protein
MVWSGGSATSIFSICVISIERDLISVFSIFDEFELRGE